MTAAQAIAKAEQALRTGQPNLAVVYMRRARVLIREDRKTRSLHSLDQGFRRAGMTLLSMTVTMEEAGQAFQVVGRSLMEEAMTR